MPSNRRKAALYRETKEGLRGMFPAAFPPKGAPKKPLAIGIHRQIMEREDIPFSNKRIRDFFFAYTTRPKYLAVSRADVSRVNLDGSDAGPVGPSGEAVARLKLKRQVEAILAPRIERRKTTSLLKGLDDFGRPDIVDEILAEAGIPPEDARGGSSPGK